MFNRTLNWNLWCGQTNIKSTIPRWEMHRMIGLHAWHVFGCFWEERRHGPDLLLVTQKSLHCRVWAQEERTFCSSDSPSTSLVSLASKSSKQSDLPWMILRVSEIPLNSPLRAFQAFSCTTEPLSGLVDIWCSSHGCFSSEFCCQAHQSGPSSQALSPVVQHRAALLLHSGVQPVSCLKKCL